MVQQMKQKAAVSCFDDSSAQKKGLTSQKKTGTLPSQRAGTERVGLDREGLDQEVSGCDRFTMLILRRLILLERCE